MAEDRVGDVARIIAEGATCEGGDERMFWRSVAEKVIAHLDAEAEARWRGAVEALRLAHESVSEHERNSVSHVAMQRALAILTTAAPTPCPRCVEFAKALDWSLDALGNFDLGTENEKRAEFLRLLWAYRDSEEAAG